MITNTFTPTTATIEATKSINEWGKAESFTFNLEAVSAVDTADQAITPIPVPANLTAVATKTNTTASFGEIKYGQAGTYTYTITEVNDGVDGVTYDTTPHKVVVTVTKDSDNKLSAVVKYDEDQDSLMITNTFTPTTATIEATKELTGREWNDDDEFTFTLKAKESSSPMPDKGFDTVTVTKENPTGIFGSISFQKAGEYEYTVTETTGNKGGLTYDTSDHVVKVIVTKDPKTNALSAVVQYENDEGLIVSNTYTSKGEYTFEAKKELIGHALEEGMFSAELLDENGSVLQTVKNDANGQFVFDKLEYDQSIFQTEDGYVSQVEKTYVIREVKEDRPEFTYDETEYTVTLILEDDQEGTITVTPKDPAEEMNFVFRNEYQPKGKIILEASKKYEGGTLKADMFSFELHDADGKVIQTVKNDANGKVLFKEILVDETVFEEGQTTATLKFSVNEVIPQEKVTWITYDTRTYVATVTLTKQDDGTIQTEIVWSTEGKEAPKAEFINYCTEKPPKTGDTNHTVYLFLAMLFSLLLIAVLIPVGYSGVRKREKRHSIK